MKKMTHLTKAVIFLLLVLFNTVQAEVLPEKPIVVLITSFNNADWYERNLEILFKQKYDNYRVIYVDDLSPDGTADLVEAYVKKAGQEHRFTLIRNQVRNLALGNIFYAVHSCNDWDIIVSYDGDDWFTNDGVLAKINECYTKKKCWLTHGSIIEYPSNHVGWSIPIPADIVKNNAFRQYRCPSHLRTFYAWLFKKIDEEDLKYDGKFFEMTWDMAMMYPMIEMAGERHAFIKDLLYVYNMRTPLNDNKVNANLQRYYDMWIRAMPPYERLDDSEVPDDISE
jgi:glycosyltransferase involved in cell wall biosynthesis